MPCSQTVKGICCVISAISTHLILGNAYTWANINVYYVSYVRLHNSNFDLMDGFFMVPILLFLNNYLIMPSGYIEKYIGPRIFNLGCFVSALSAHVLLYFFTNYWIIMFSMALFGFGFGIGYFPMLKTSWRYFPEKKGLITGIVLCCIGFSTFIFTSLADFIINPNKEKPINDYFEKRIAEKTQKCILVMIIIISCLGVISNCLVFPYVEEGVIATPTTQVQTQNEGKGEYIQKERIKEVVRNKEFYLLGTMAVGNMFIGFLVTNTNRTFGSICKIDENLLQTLSKVYSLLNGITRVLWGFIFDKVNFRILYPMVIINYMICSFSYYFCGFNGIAFFIVNCMASFSFSGNATMFNPVLIHYFGIKNSVILSGLYSFVIGAVGFISPVLCKFIVKDVEDFLIIYMIGGGFSLISFAAFCFMKPDPYVYTWRSIREQEEFGQGPNDFNNQISQPLVGDSSTAQVAKP